MRTFLTLEMSDSLGSILTTEGSGLTHNHGETRDGGWQINMIPSAKPVATCSFLLTACLPSFLSFSDVNCNQWQESNAHQTAGNGWGLCRHLIKSKQVINKREFYRGASAVGWWRGVREAVETHTHTHQRDNRMTSAIINTMILCFNVKQGEGWEREWRRAWKRGVREA